MAGPRGRPAIASDDWMLEQQLRAEMEAEAWRRLRYELAIPDPTPAVPNGSTETDRHSSGSTILKALVRFMLGAFVAYLAYLAGVDSGFGEFEVWLAVGSTFAITLALSMFGVAREFVHMLAETMRWIIITGAGVGALWLAFNWAG